MEASCTAPWASIELRVYEFHGGAERLVDAEGGARCCDLHEERQVDVRSGSSSVSNSSSLGATGRGTGRRIEAATGGARARRAEGRGCAAVTGAVRCPLVHPHTLSFAPTWIASTLAWQLGRLAGAPAALCSSARTRHCNTKLRSSRPEAGPGAAMAKLAVLGSLGRLGIWGCGAQHCP